MSENLEKETFRPVGLARGSQEEVRVYAQVLSGSTRSAIRLKHVFPAHASICVVATCRMGVVCQGDGEIREQAKQRVFIRRFSVRRDEGGDTQNNVFWSCRHVVWEGAGQGQEWAE